MYVVTFRVASPGSKPTAKKPLAMVASLSALFVSSTYDKASIVLALSVTLECVGHVLQKLHMNDASNLSNIYGGFLFFLLPFSCSWHIP